MRQALRLMLGLALVGLLVAPTVASAQEWKGKADLRGKVLDDKGQPVKDAIVRMRMGAAAEGPKDAKTNGKGEFRVKDLATGEWQVEVGAEEYAARMMKVSVEPRGSTVEITLINLAELQQTIEAGNQLFQSGDFAGARAEYMKILEAQPELTDIHRNIAFTYGREGNHAEALKHMELLLEADKKGSTSSLTTINASPAEARTQVLMLAADAAMQTGQYEKMHAFLQEINPLVLQEPAMMINVAIGLMNKDNAGEALKVLDTTAQAFPDTPLTHFYKGLAMLRMQKNDEAKPELERFVEMAGSDAEYSGQVKQAQDILAKLGS